ncbi:hypothetical protein JHN52_01170 [Streptomyces sp. MBT97]|uniref:hypothetical protein n=1 Tax=Streptomyces sp. MBT97 TaxID=2800411 RepID=UPI00190A8FB0|nr:hypothetical protein [Streptomyces sp. MBT97]MBK3631591.1 hypothetical protein [Streptomyces sp. MBT97]
MSRIPPARTTADRARVHIKALLEELKRQTTSGPPDVQGFLSGMLSGLAASVEILDGGTAEASLERMAQRLSSAVRAAHLAGKLPPRAPAADDQADEDARRAARRSDIRERLEQLSCRGILSVSAAETLRNQVEAEMREADTARAVAAGNLRHVKTLVPELEQAQAAVDRVRAVGPELEYAATGIGLAEPAREAMRDASRRIRDALDGTVSPAEAMTAAGAPVTTGVTSGIPGWRAADHVGHGSPCEEQPAGSCAGPPTSALRDQIAAALYERERPPQDPAWPDAYAADREVFGAMADTVLAVVLPTTRLLGELHRFAHEDLTRVIDLYERWVKAGPPQLGISIARWWDARLLELRHAVVPEPSEDPS